MTERELHVLFLTFKKPFSPAIASSSRSMILSLAIRTRELPMTSSYLFKILRHSLVLGVPSIVVFYSPFSSIAYKCQDARKSQRTFDEDPRRMIMPYEYT